MEGTQTYDRKWIKHGMEVAHKDFPDQKLYVDHIKTEVKKIATGQSDKDGRPIYENKTRVTGVQVRYREDGRWKYMRFHTREIVPWEIAQQGIEAIIAFMERDL